MGGGLGDGHFAAQGGLRALEADAVAQGAEAETGFAFQFPGEMVGMIPEVAGNFLERSGGANAVAEFFEKREDGRVGDGRVVEETGHDGEDRRIVGQREPAFARNAREQRVELVQSRGREGAVGGADAAGVLELVVEHKTERAAAAGDGKAVRNVRRDDEEVPGASPAAPAVHGLHAFAGKVENQLRIGVAVGCDLRVAMAVELEFAQDKIQRVDFDFLDEQGTPGEHGTESY